MAKRRSPRLRKKLRTGEFRQGFWFSAGLHDALDVTRELELRYGFMAYLERHGLACTGGVDGGFIARSGQESATEADREALRGWLGARTEVRSLDVGPLVACEQSDER